MGDRLTGAQQKQLMEALDASVTSYDDLAMFLRFHLEVRLADISEPDKLPLVIYRVIQEAETKGWLLRLVRSARLVYAETHRFDEFADTVPEPGIRTTSGDLLAEFDLVMIENAFRTARKQGANQPLIAVAVISPAAVFERCLVERLKSVVGQSMYRKYSLSASAFTVTRVMDSLADVKESMSKCSAMIHISVGGDDGGALVDPFWSAFRSEFGTVAKQVVLLMTLPCPLALPPDVKQLPDPILDEGVIDAWLSGIAKREKWTGAQQTCVFDRTWELVQDATEDARAIILYDELQNILNDIQSDPIDLNGRFSAA